MTARARRPVIRAAGGAGWLLALPLLAFLVLPAIALLVASSPGELASAFRHPMMARATWLSARTTFLSLAIIVAAGTPLSWWLSRSRRTWTRVLETLIEMPIVVPPAVVGVALLETYGRHGLLGPFMTATGWSVPFTTSAVVVAQVALAAPFYVQSATAGFRRVDEDLLLVARTLGARPLAVFLRVAVPSAMPALLSGAAMAWARAVGEFGATLLFAGNMPGRTQTMPLAIYSALEADIGLARALALVLGGAAFLALLLLRLAPALHHWIRGTRLSRPELAA